jgi:hypothetical protein
MFSVTRVLQSISEYMCYSIVLMLLAKAFRKVLCCGWAVRPCPCSREQHQPGSPSRPRCTRCQMYISSSPPSFHTSILLGGTMDAISVSSPFWSHPRPTTLLSRTWHPPLPLHHRSRSLYENPQQALQIPCAHLQTCFTPTSSRPYVRLNEGPYVNRCRNHPPCTCWTPWFGKWSPFIQATERERVVWIKVRALHKR